jgi:hypothetical protein
MPLVLARRLARLQLGLDSGCEIGKYVVAEDLLVCGSTIWFIRYSMSVKIKIAA